MVKVFMKTYGCQMNFYDTEAAKGLLAHAGCDLLEETPAAFKSADVIIFNTCSVREHAEMRVYGQLHALKQEKQNGRRDLIIGLMGCMADEHREKLFQRFPHLDFLCGTRSIRDIPQILNEVQKTRRQTAGIKKTGLGIEYSDLTRRAGGIHAWLPIMTGCNKVCTYCIVPKTRGSEISMDTREVYREACRLADQGYRHLTLLGQNVNSYGKDLVGRAGQKDFPGLLRLLNEIDGIKLISFTTSHPEDATPELFEAIRDCKKVSRRFHLPLQSGSDRILKRMKRLHTYEQYKAKVNRLRELVPEITVTTDIIAGFCGETDTDFEATKQAMQELQFESAFIFKYSPRPGTPADKLEDDVPQAVKEKRNRELLQLQTGISNRIFDRDLGACHTVLVAGVSRKNPSQLLAQTQQERPVVFEGAPSMIGTVQRVRFENRHSKTFIGTCLQ